MTTITAIFVFLIFCGLFPRLAALLTLLFIGLCTLGVNSP
jgi:hypothetical protein